MKESVSRIGWVLVGSLLYGLLWSQALAQDNDPNCPLKIVHYGPYDYRNEQDKLAVVNRHHFTPRVEALLRGESSYLGEDISYTLKASPNHHRALVSLVKLWERTKTDPPPHAGFTVECFFFRGLSFRPDDHIVRMLYAQYLGKRGRQAEAIRHLQVALESAGDNALTHYNIGLLMFELKELPLALKQAHLAKRLGYPRPELEDSLRKAGAWQDPTE